MSIPITVNGQSQTALQGQTILGLLEILKVDPEQVAVELDRRIVRRPKWGDTVLAPGAQIEIVQFVGGG